MIVSRIAAQCLFVDVEDGVHTAVAVHVTGDLPAPRKVGPDDFGQLFTGVIGAPAGTGRYTDGTGGGGVQVGKGQIDIADPRRAVHPDLDAHLAQHVVTLPRRRIGAHPRIGDLVGAQPDRQFGAHRLDHRPIPWVKSHLRACGQAGTVEPSTLGAQHGTEVAGVGYTGQKRKNRADFLGGAVEFAIAVAAILRALGIRGVSGEPIEPGGVRVEVSLVSGVVDDHQRPVRREAVEPGQRRLAKTGLQQRIPADQIGAGRAAPCNLAADRGNDVVRVPHRHRTDIDEPVRQHDRLQ
ncbi:Uncharacterised protein [Mycobacterium tuberculosis]|uniref:Uncharacterized protein n=1 Tax=Mycobacterium tuberculosis TaxID=1773 RepID=A0A655IZH4_MYCTX|nr:Uncharacterised protein [Mycobacterium tuberculosis]CFR44955.1 Uncharacterised protein [Mycobacterium tuberculosis]CFS31335.1 Uncharacterised protein [Mycobacterium tuberculosis]CFV11191.1 Uncharacterised protein [Mycobacterium tuberculosis]CKR07984.1 Uncharacterised protein [Mycobacterium tuberculosis]